MIKVKFAHEQEINTIVLKVEGHAGQNAKGKDVICSAASMLASTLAQYLLYIHNQGGLVKKPRIELKDGKALIVAKPKAEYEGEVLNAYFVTEVGYSLLAKNYPQYVEVDLFGEA